MNNDIVLEQAYNTSIEKLWSAITEKELMKKWYFDIADFQPEVGHQFSFEGGREDERYLHLCKVLAVVPLKKLQYSWQYKGYEGLSTVTFELTGDREKSSLKLTHTGTETFTNPEFASANFVEGWNYLINESLKAFLENGEALRTW